MRMRLFGEKRMRMSLSYALCALACLVDMAVADIRVLAQPSVARVGEAVVVTVESETPLERLEGDVTTPTGRHCPLTFERRGDGAFSASFDQTADKGFMTPDWNRYRVRVEGTVGAGRVESGATEFRLDERDKTLYVIQWVDDFGAGGDMPRAFVEWYHEQAGPIAFMLQHDDRRSYDLDALLAGYDFTYDYLGHHFQVGRWSGSRAALFLNNRVYAPYLCFRYWTRDRLSVDLVRARNIVPALLLIVVVFAARYARTRRRVFLAMATVAAAVTIGYIGLRFNYVRIDNLRNWSFEHNNRDWCHGFLREAAAMFGERGYAFPPVVRHGWNLPPVGMMGVYMSEFGVLADASPISGMGTNDFLERFGYRGRTIVWRETPLPYYAGLSSDYNTPWNGNEADRGILILPLTFPNCTIFAVDDRARARVRDLPNGAQMATYIHPHETWGTIQDLVAWLNRTYSDVRYVRPDDYTALYMKHDPRPVLIDTNRVAHWAWLDRDRLRPIRETDVVEVAVVQADAAGTTLSVSVRTLAPVPLVKMVEERRKVTGVRVDGETLDVALSDDGPTLRNLAPGEHVLTLSF